MGMTDPVADLLTRIRNANTVHHDIVEVPSSKMKKSIVDIMLNEGYLKNIEEFNDGSVPMLRLTMKYANNKQKVITGLKRISKPGLRVYTSNEEIPQVLNGLGIAIISTSKGIMTDKEAKKSNVGGEVICYIW